VQRGGCAGLIFRIDLSLLSAIEEPDLLFSIATRARTRLSVQPPRWRSSRPCRRRSASTAPGLAGDAVDRAGRRAVGGRTRDDPRDAGRPRVARGPRWVGAGGSPTTTCSPTSSPASEPNGPRVRGATCRQAFSAPQDWPALLSVTQVAELLLLNRQTVQAMIARGELPAPSRPASCGASPQKTSGRSCRQSIRSRWPEAPLARRRVGLTALAKPGGPRSPALRV
jgi:hypothetical protein